MILEAVNGCCVATHHHSISENDLKGIDDHKKLGRFILAKHSNHNYILSVEHVSPVFETVKPLLCDLDFAEVELDGLSLFYNTANGIREGMNNDLDYDRKRKKNELEEGREPFELRLGDVVQSRLYDTTFEILSFTETMYNDPRTKKRTRGIILLSHHTGKRRLNYGEGFPQHDYQRVLPS